jgi:CheY-like chemotaxis protein
VWQKIATKKNAFILYDVPLASGIRKLDNLKPEPRMLVLIVDDDLDDITLFCDAVREIDADSQCMLAKNGREALTLLESMSELPDIIFLDINMPIMNGKEFLLIGKQDSRLKGIPIVMYSTTNKVKEIEEYYRLGATGFLTKAIKFNKVVEDVRTILTRFKVLK